LNPRQEKALLRVLCEDPDSFKGGLSAGNYVAITGTSAPTATRDLAYLVNKGVLVRNGERRYACYRPNIPYRPVKLVEIDGRGHVTTL
jgi:Fic family protein